MTRQHLLLAALGLALVALARHAWQRLGDIEAELNAAEQELAERD
ncbi:hypothetical protein [Actinocrispum wychmicini]|uniref:Uncharacterized protein n=1 Tax=Actinocrispum wychmicini TaxID=1213861 RepID=A0A4R2K3P5_9PSEU|nr:hypothetical protein [Actinocrispum wychmicini]TCO64398.1 hypothetical protein EV192_101166 [Actinocrispum wychmicini]